MDVRGVDVRGVDVRGVDVRRAYSVQASFYLSIVSATVVSVVLLCSGAPKLRRHPSHKCNTDGNKQGRPSLVPRLLPRLLPLGTRLGRPRSSLVPRPLMRRNSLVNQVEFLGLVHTFVANLLKKGTDTGMNKQILLL